MSLKNSSIFMLRLICFFFCCSFVLSVEIDTDCLWFLDDHATSPFVYMENFHPHKPASRNITKDELAEANCEEMLKRPSLSLKNKRRIYEGLSLLSIIHVNLGLSKHTYAMKHLKSLANFDPKNYDYQARTGMWAMQLNVSSFKDAAYFLHSALYDTTAPQDEAQDKLQLQRNLGVALGLLGKSEAQNEWLKILTNHPSDFEVAFLLKDSSSLTSRFLNNSLSPSIDINAAYFALNQSEYLYQLVQSFAGKNISYTGYTSKTIDVMNIMPSTDVFNEYVTERQPLVLSPSKKNENWESWKSEHFEFNKLIREAGQEQLEVTVRPARSDGLLGFGVDTYKKRSSFKSFIQGRYAKLSKTNQRDEAASTASDAAESIGSSSSAGKDKSVKSYEEFLSLQPSYTGNGTLRSPVHKLVPDLSQPLMLRDLHGKQRAQAHLFMGNARLMNGTNTRIAFEPFDFLFMNVEGTCTFKMMSPKFALSMQTILPIYHVHKNGVPVTYNPISEGDKAGSISSAFCSSIASMDDPALGAAAGEYSTVELKSGDMLFVPAGWFFQTHLPQGQHIGIVFSWRPPESKAAHRDVDAKAALIAKALQDAEVELLRSEQETNELETVVEPGPDSPAGLSEVAVEATGEAVIQATSSADALVLQTGTSLSFCSTNPTKLFTPGSSGGDCVPLSLSISSEGKVRVATPAGEANGDHTVYWEEDLRPLWARLNRPQSGKGPVLVYRFHETKLELFKPRKGSSEVDYSKPWKILYVSSKKFVS